jgi:hypothetical protein
MTRPPIPSDWGLVLEEPWLNQEMRVAGGFVECKLHFENVIPGKYKPSPMHGPARTHLWPPGVARATGIAMLLLGPRVSTIMMRQKGPLSPRTWSN